VVALTRLDLTLIKVPANEAEVDAPVDQSLQLVVKNRIFRSQVVEHQSDRACGAAFVRPVRCAS
jgi:hypothetical protein